MKSFSECEKDLIMAARHGLKVMNDESLDPGKRALELSKVMAGLAQAKANLEFIRSEAIRSEKRVFSRVLSGAEGRSQEERFAHSKGSEEFLKALEYVDYIEARYSECRSLMAAFKHAILTFRGMMGMKQ